MHFIPTCAPGNLVDTHHQFSAAVSACPQLRQLESSLRATAIASETEFRAVMDRIYAESAALPPHLEITVAGHLGRLAVDQWEMAR